MKNRIIDYFFPLIVCPLLIADLFFKVLPAPYILVLMVVLFFLRANFYENTFMMLLFYPLVAGFLLNYNGISGVGGLLTPVGVIFVFFWLTKKGNRLIGFDKSMILLCALMAWLIMSAVTTTGGNYAIYKTIKTAWGGFTALLAFSFLFTNFEKFDTIKIGLAYLLYSLCLLRWSLDINTITGPDGLFDIGFMRNQTLLTLGYEAGVFHVDYQNTGFYCVLGAGFALISKGSENSYIKGLIILICSIGVLYIGSRQAIITMFGVAVLWSLFGPKDGILMRLLTSALIILILIYLIPVLFLGEGLFGSVSEFGYVEGGGRGEWLMSGMRQFKVNRLTGVGFGRFVVFGKYGSYAHNLIIELLCETGILGLLYSLILAVSQIIKHFKEFRCIFFLFFVYLMRSLASGSLEVNIALFCILFVLPAFKAFSSSSQ